MARICYAVFETIKTTEGDYTPVIIKEGVSGYHETNWSYGKDFAAAEERVKHKNEALGLTQEDVHTIILSSMKE